MTRSDVVALSYGERHSIDDYVYVVPFIEEGGRAFLKTIIPSRKATRAYLKTK